MARMLGKATRINRQHGWFWWCCEGHDGTWKDYIKANKQNQRRREERQWRKEYNV